MKKKKSSIIVMVSMFAFSLITATTADAGCNRHVYNKSKDTWVFMLLIDGKTYKEYTLAPNKTADFVLHGGWNAEMRFKTDTYDETFPLEDVRSKDCYKIKHTGITGRAVLNEPADGDATLID